MRKWKKEFLIALSFLLLLSACGVHTIETTPTPETTPTHTAEATPALEATPAPTAEPTPASSGWIRLGSDETPPPGAWVRFRPDEEGLYGQEYLISTVTWSFDEDTKTLTFSGEGSLPDGVLTEDYSYGLPMEVMRFPWDTVRDSVATVVLGEGIIRIPERAFEGFENLTTVKLPSTLKIIEPSAFAHCAFSEIDLPEGLEELEPEAFAFCGELLRCEIPASVYSLYRGLFRECRKLETVTLHEGLSAIGSECFAECDSLERIVIPASVEWMGSQNIKNGSTGIRTMVFLGPPPIPMLEPDVGYTIMDCIPNGMTIFYPEEVTERTILQDDDWSNYAGKYDGYTWITGLPEDMK